MPKLFSRHGGSRLSAGSSVSEDLRTLFRNFSSNGCMRASHFCRFLNDVQQEGDVSETHASDLMKLRLGAATDAQFDENQFFNYLFDTELNFAILNEIHQDMTLPLSQYYIFTGHNSYLTGNQLNSKSSVKPIIEALQKGVRVVELDLWPGDDKDIDVVHGRTLTTPVSFETCLSAIKENAFIKSQYPVIITLEVHLSVDLQAKAAQIIMDTLGSQLYIPPVKDFSQFPSPEELKGRILISTKPPKEYGQAHKPEDSECLSGDEEEESYEGSYDDRDGSSGQQKHVSEDYMNIIAIRQGKKGKSLLNALMVEERAKRISLSEPQFAKIAASNSAILARFTQNNILRVYPRQWRVDSSNYNPMKAWLFGAQMVALNMQGYGKHLWVAQGFFRANGGCGYVKKPKFLCSEEISLSNFNAKDTTLVATHILKVKVCMCLGWREELGENSFDKSSPPDFFTRIGIGGVRADKVMKETAIKKDVWEPCWDHEFVFMLRVPELAVLRIEVHEDNKSGSKFAGQICLPIRELKCGYRVVNLCDKKGTIWTNVKLLLCIHLASSANSTYRR